MLAALLTAFSPSVFAEGTLAVPAPAPKVDVEAMKRQILGDKATVQEQAKPEPAQQASDKGCQGTGDLNKLLSPECLESLQALRAPVSKAAAPPQPSTFSRTPVQCTVAAYVGAPRSLSAFSPQGGAMTSFQTPSLERCIEIAAALSYGTVGVTNIAALHPSQGVIAVTCQREAPNGHRIACQPQPSTQGKR